ncbi:OLC1v1002840C1 [Oldenlandia corymbosa var. corymbosa]|uniref:OLC1v1002840C1 n=1 Tax=Oldenlandia corymbosa var. corymbosa TaxID=529605 RepID=A0AAV1DAB9_OLDCO|nr:OLC1v1002840C1 [Oldenlandia corymbosa var. corymbosa]
MAASNRQGRKKLEIKKIEDESRLGVSFTKRRAGIMKKASELCTLCGAKAAVIIFSPKNKVYSFGNPNVESVVNDYLSGNPVRFLDPRSAAGTQQAANLQALNEELQRLEDLVEAHQRQAEVLDEARQKRVDKGMWWDQPIDSLNLRQLEELSDKMQLLKVNVCREINKQRTEGAAAVADDIPTFAVAPMNTVYGGDNLPINVAGTSGGGGAEGEIRDVPSLPDRNHSGASGSGLN